MPKPDYILAPFTIVIDQQEKHPWTFDQYTADSPHNGKRFLIPTISQHLATGDYSLQGYERRISIERKNPEDALATCNPLDDERYERFKRELARMSEMDFGAVVVEANWENLLHRGCPVCGGSGVVIPDDTNLTLVLDPKAIRALRSNGFDAAGLIRRELAAINSLRQCAFCEGHGKVPAGKFSPKRFYRAVNSLEVRFPKIRWEFCTTRNWAERRALRWLQKFHKENPQAKEAAEAAV